MKSYIGIAIMLLGCLSWPATADLADIQPVVQYALPADIMQVEFASETWVYRLYEDGSVKKIICRRVVATQDKNERENTHLVNLGHLVPGGNPFLWAWTEENPSPPLNTNNA